LVDRKTSQRGVGGGDYAVSVAGGSFGWVSIFSSFEARSALFHSPPGDTRPLSMLIVVLWFRRCLLRPGCSAVTGAWFPRARVLFTIWPRVWARFVSLPCRVVSQGFSCFRWLLGLAPRRRVCCTRRLRWVFPPSAAPALGVFLLLQSVFNSFALGLI
jgi:hypothetical protein